MSRLEFSRKDRRAIIERAAGKCEACGAVLKPGEAEVDHVLPAALGGKPDIANGMCLCRVCHAEKTRGDVRRIRKGDRQRDKNSGAWRPKQKLHSRNDLRTRQERPAKLPLPERKVSFYQTKEAIEQ